MEKRMKMALVPHWFMEVPEKGNQSVVELNREIRNWLAREIGSGSWETEITSRAVRVYFDLEAEDDAMAFKLGWT